MSGKRIKEAHRFLKKRLQFNQTKVDKGTSLIRSFLGQQKNKKKDRYWDTLKTIVLGEKTQNKDRYWGDTRTFLINILSEEDFYKIIQNMRLECRKCGRCCIAYPVPELKKKAGERCKHLAENNTCSVYKTRPDICQGFPALLSKEKDLFSVVKSNSFQMKIGAMECPLIKDFWDRVCEVEKPLTHQAREKMYERAKAGVVKRG